jgi:hypothetical protein
LAAVAGFEAARHLRREPSAGLVLRLVELQHQIDVADLERTASTWAEDPDPSIRP